MPKPAHLHASDIRAIARLAATATVGIIDLVEAMHRSVLNPRAGMDPIRPVRTTGLTGSVYKTVNGVARLVGSGVDAALGRLLPFFEDRESTPEREAVLAALNGVLGDHLAATENPLAIAMRLRREGRPLALERKALRREFQESPAAGGKLLVLAHGLCMNDLQWQRAGHDHGAALAREFGCTPLYLHYNTGLHTSINGRAFSALLQQLVREWPRPVEELVVVCHSMGGLVARSAVQSAPGLGHDWPRLLRKLVFLGTPHHGAPLERIGNMIDNVLQATPYAAPLARLGKIRSAGITDLRYGNVVDEDWRGRDRFAPVEDMRLAVPLPAGVDCYTLAAVLGSERTAMRSRLLGDGLVPLPSALGRHADPSRTLAFPKKNRFIAYGTGHMDLLSRPEVFQQMRHWLGELR